MLSSDDKNNLVNKGDDEENGINPEKLNAFALALN